MSSDQLDLQKYRIKLDKNLKEIIGHQKTYDCLQEWLVEQGMGNMSPEQTYNVARKVVKAIREGLIMDGLSNPLNRRFLDGFDKCNWYFKGASNMDSVAYAASDQPRPFQDKAPEVDRVLLENATEVVAALARFAPKNDYIRKASETCSKNGVGGPDCIAAIREMASRVNILDLKGSSADDTAAQLLLARLAQS